MERERFEKNNLKHFEKVPGDDLEYSEDEMEPIDLTIESPTMSSDQKADGENGRKIKLRKPKRHILTEEEMGEKRQIANTQERRRMKRLSQALDNLRKVIPQQYHLYHRKLSKIRTLRLATSYIAALSDMLAKDDAKLQQVMFDRSCEFSVSQNNMNYQTMCTETDESPNSQTFCNTPRSSCIYGPKFLSSSNKDLEQHQVSGLCFQYSPAFYQTPPSRRRPMFVTPTKYDYSPYVYGTVLHKPHISNITDSPTVEIRNPNELNTSFLSSTSDDFREEEARKFPPYLRVEGIYPLPNTPVKSETITTSQTH